MEKVKGKLYTTKIKGKKTTYHIGPKKVTKGEFQTYRAGLMPGKKKSTMKKALVGKQKNLPEELKKKILASPAQMKKMKASAATMKKAAMKLKKESAMKLKKSMAMLKKSMATMKKASAMKLKLENPKTANKKFGARTRTLTGKQKAEMLKKYKEAQKKAVC